MENASKEDQKPTTGVGGLDKGRYIEVKRKDGLVVFLDKDDSDLTKWLNTIRMNGTKQEVVMAVGLVRGYQIAMNYAKKSGIQIPSFAQIAGQYRKEKVGIE